MSNDEIQAAIERLNGAEPADRVEAIAELSHFDTPQVRTAFLQALGAIRVGAMGRDYEVAPLIDALASWGDARCVPIIFALLESDLDSGEDHQIETTALEALGKLRSTEALPVLERKLTTKEFARDFFEELTEAIAAIGGDEAEKILLAALADKK